MKARIIACIAAAAAICSAATLSAAEQKLFLSMGTYTTGSSQYIYGGLFSGLARQHLPNMSITNEGTNGTTQNLDLMRRGEMDMGVASPERLYNAVHGTGQYENNAVPAGPLWVFTEQATLLFVLANSPIKNWQDLKGKRVAIGPAGSSNETKNAFILEAAGFKRVEGAIDASIATQPIPDPAHAELAYTTPLRFIGVDAAMVENLKSIYKWMWPTTVKAGSFKGQDQDIATVGDPNYIAGNTKKLSEQAAYDLTKAYVEKLLPEMAKSIHELKIYVDDPAKLSANWIVPGHPGAVRYYKEKGIPVSGGGL
jgi:TRAP-type uncharacterized transport system substrate-binding protein